MTTRWAITAEQELERDPSLKKEDLKELREWISSQPHLPNVEDEMILHFLHACFYDVTHAKNTIDHFYTYKNSMPDFFSGWDPTSPDIQSIVNDVLIAGPLPKLTKEGYKIIVCKLNDTDVHLFNYPLCVKWITMSGLVSQWSDGIHSGYIIVYDSTGFSMSHMLKCSLHHVKNYINYGKNASSIRVIKVVFINTSSVVKRMLSLIKPFLSKDLLNMMSFHTNPDSFFNDFEPENVPEDYGGKALPILSLHRDYIKQIVSHREHLMFEETIKVDESKRIKAKSKPSPPQSVKEKSGTAFRSLDID